MEFHELNLHPDLQKGIDEAGFTTCMPVQEMVFSHSLAGGDIYAQSQTGTGKTAAFLISIMQRIMSESSLRSKKVLIYRPPGNWRSKSRPRPGNWASICPSALEPFSAA